VVTPDCSESLLERLHESSREGKEEPDKDTFGEAVPETRRQSGCEASDIVPCIIVFVCDVKGGAREKWLVCMPIPSRSPSPGDSSNNTAFSCGVNGSTDSFSCVCRRRTSLRWRRDSLPLHPFGGEKPGNLSRKTDVVTLAALAASATALQRSEQASLPSPPPSPLPLSSPAAAPPSLPPLLPPTLLPLEGRAPPLLEVHTADIVEEAGVKSTPPCASSCSCASRRRTALRCRRESPPLHPFGASPRIARAIAPSKCTGRRSALLLASLVVTPDCSESLLERLHESSREGKEEPDKDTFGEAVPETRRQSGCGLTGSFSTAGNRPPAGITPTAGTPSSSPATSPLST